MTYPQYLVLFDGITVVECGEHLLLATINVNKRQDESPLLVAMSAQCSGDDDLQFDVTLRIDGDLEMPFGRMNAVLDSPNSKAAMPFAARRFLTDLPAGEHKIEVLVANLEFSGLLYLDAGASIQIDELVR
jgi:hypothetical protein